MPTPTDKQMIVAARVEYQDDGRVEIDDNAEVSRDDDEPQPGAYVAAWVWVDYEHVNDL